MSKIPKEIVDKIEQRNKLNEEIETWCKENLDMDGMDSDCADITDHHTGNEQGSDKCNSRKAGKPECLKNSKKECNDCGSSTENSVGGVYARHKTDQ